MSTCIHCGEPMEPSESLFRYANGPRAHKECFLRQVLGSVAHQQHRCCCYVAQSTCEDDPLLSKREAAQAAVAYFYGDGGVH